MFATLLGSIPGVGPVLSLFAGNWKILAAIAGAAVLAFFVWSWTSRGNEINSLEEANSILQANLTDTKRMLDLEKQANAAAIARMADAATTNAKLAHIKETASHATSSDDGAVAPVLRGTLDALSWLRKPTGR